MPIYEYHCDACNKDFEELVFGDAAPACPHCGATATRKLMSCCAFAAGGGDGEMSMPSSSGGSGGCAGCAGGNCASCGR